MLTFVFSVFTVLCAHAKVTRDVGLSEKTFRYREHVCIYLYGIAIYEVYMNIYMHTQIVRTVKYIYDREDQRILINSVMLQKCG